METGRLTSSHDRTASISKRGRSGALVNKRAADRRAQLIAPTIDPDDEHALSKASHRFSQARCGAALLPWTRDPAKAECRSNERAPRSVPAQTPVASLLGRLADNGSDQLALSGSEIRGSLSCEWINAESDRIWLPAQYADVVVQAAGQATHGNVCGFVVVIAVEPCRYVWQAVPELRLNRTVVPSTGRGRSLVAALPMSRQSLDMRPPTWRPISRGVACHLSTGTRDGTR